MLSIVALFVVFSGLIVYATQVEPFDVGVSFDQLAITLSAAGPPLSTALRRRIGRPRKFAAPSRAVTLTLPETVIDTLSALDPDLSRAVVALAKEPALANGRPPAEVAAFGRRAVISVRPTPSLERRIGIELVPLPDGRALISFDQPKSIADVELLLNDALADPALADDDRKVFEGITAILMEARRSNEVSLLRRSIIVLESAGKAPKAVAKPPGR